MSLILDALRKSEEHRRLGETPTLINESVWASRRKRAYGESSRRAWWWLLPVIAAVAVGAWWLGTRNGVVPAVVTTPAPAATPTSAVVTSATTAVDAPAAQPIAPAPARKPDALAQLTPSPTPMVAPTMPQTVQDAEHGAAVLEPGTREQFQQGELFANNAERLKPVEPTPAAAVGYVPPEAALPQPLAEPEEASAQSPAPTASPSATPTAPLVLPPSPPATVVNAVPAAAPVATPPNYADALITIYDLPLATRKSLPSLKLSMHVYTADPAGRFVILDGKHVAEGQPLDNDLNVREIRADGVVLDLRGQRFLLPRGGR